MRKKNYLRPTMWIYGVKHRKALFYALVRKHLLKYCRRKYAVFAKGNDFKCKYSIRFEY